MGKTLRGDRQVSDTEIDGMMRKPGRSPKARMLRKRLLPFWRIMALKSPTPEDLERALGLVLFRNGKAAHGLRPAISSYPDDDGQE